MIPTLKNSTVRLRRPIPKSLLIAGLSCMMASSMFAATYNWAGALTGNIDDTSQWSPVASPGLGFSNQFYIETTGASVTQSANVSVGNLYVASTSGAPAVFTMSHNIATNNANIIVGSLPGINGVSGTLNQTAGTLYEQYNGGGPWIAILIGCSHGVTGNTGIYNFGGPSPGPTITAPGTGGGIFIGGGTSNQGTLSLSGYGTINTLDPLYVGTADSWISSGGTGTLNITGGNQSISVGALYLGGHYSGSTVVAGGTTAALNETIDSTGISAINATTVRIDTSATLSVTLSGTSPTPGNVYTLIQSTNPISGTFAGLAEGSYLQSGSQWFTISYLSDKVTITAITTPTSIPAWLDEGFNYTNGSAIDGSSQNGGTGFAVGSSWAADSTATVGTGLTYPGLLTSGAGALHGTNYGLTVRNTLPISGPSYYMAFLINMHGHETTRCGPELRLNGGDGVMFGRVNGGWGLFDAGTAFGITSSGGSYHTWKGIAAAADSNTHLVVYKFDSVAKTVSLWVDPTVSTTIPTPDAVLSTGTVDPTPGHTGTWTVTLGTTFNGFRLWHDAPCDIDEVRFGGYWQSVLPAPSTVSTLSGLALSSGTLSPTFTTGTTSYTASVSNATSSITVTPTVTDSTATVTVDGTAVTSGSASGAIALSVGSNTITTVVTAQDGVTTTTYTVGVTRSAPPTHSISGTVTLGGTGLSGVTVSDGTRTATTNGSGAYTIANVPDVATYTVTPTLTGYTFTPASHSVTLSGSDVTGENFAVANAFGNWATINGLSGAAAFQTANPSGDGISNLVKYALGLDPNKSAQPPGTVSGGTLTFNKGTMAQGDSNLTYTIEESTDLVTWTRQTGSSVTNGPTSITYTYPTGQAQVFARLKVIQTP